MAEDLKFTINNKVEISWDDGYYKSNIENVDDKFICISIPIKEGQYIPLRKFEQVEVIYYQGSDIYKFYTTVVDRKVDVIPIIVLAFPKEVFKVQRRKFVRVPIVCTMEYSKLENKTQNIVKAIMVDLSGGGMRIKLSNDQLSIGNLIKAYIPVGDDNVEVKGEVVRVEKDDPNKMNIYGINFLDLDDKNREKIIRFIFQIMRDQMKKGTTN
ncbi:PilZ domain-containing protein [Clostridium sp. YIM B02515]|uniref:PilZ domain-containing protein n=1 Tax=Clostridium rhizosphaerae TaxID=2803861 RepID=A0ABS1TFW8_9CLOT|nr:flagellar brake domain-containing protein [Clostridium rhizosphaerae]MBL4937977.1 PilZ domain-containing protein [Clostridium rhizosphaerae]